MEFGSGAQVLTRTCTVCTFQIAGTNAASAAELHCASSGGTQTRIQVASPCGATYDGVKVQSPQSACMFDVAKNEDDDCVYAPNPAQFAAGDAADQQRGGTAKA